MTDTQPTKFCVECKHHGVRSVREKTPVNLVHGGSHPLRSLAQDVREHECHGESTLVINGTSWSYEHACYHGNWWEEKPKPEPEPEESRYVFFDDKPIGRCTLSLIQRIKRWFG